MFTALMFALGCVAGLAAGWLFLRGRSTATLDAPDLVAQAVASEEALRQQLAEGLHRGVAQSLAAARMELSLLQRSLAPSVDANRFDLLQQITTTALTEVRDLMAGLYPQGVRIAQPDAALRLLAAYLARRHEATVEFAVVPPDSAPSVALDAHRCAVLCQCARSAIELGLAASSDKQVRLALSDSASALSLQISHAGEVADAAYALPRARLRLVAGTLQRARIDGGGQRLTMQLTRN